MTEREREDVDEPLRVALIGYGVAGAVFHAPLIAATPGMAVTAIVTADPVRQARAHDSVAGAAVIDSAETIWHDPGRYDLAVVATPNRFHAPLATAAMQRGIPVVVDKPLAISVEEGEGLIATSERTGVPFTCFQNRRWDGDFRTVRQIQTMDLLGTIVRFESRFDRYRPAIRAGAWREQTLPEEGGGLLWDLGSHLIDQALVLFGEPARVYAETVCRRSGARADDDTFVALTFANGIQAHLWMSVIARLAGPRFRLHGMRGSYEKYGLDPQEAALRAGERPGEGWGEEPREAWGHILTEVGGMTVDGAIETRPGAYPQFYAAVRDALREGKPMPVDPREAVATVRVIEAARESARVGGDIRL